MQQKLRLRVTETDGQNKKASHFHEDGVPCRCLSLVEDMQALAHVRRHAQQTVRRHMSTSLHSKALIQRVTNQNLVQDKAFINGEFVTGSSFGAASGNFSKT